MVSERELDSNLADGVETVPNDINSYQIRISDVDSWPDHGDARIGDIDMEDLESEAAMHIPSDCDSQRLQRQYTQNTIAL